MAGLYNLGKKLPTNAAAEVALSKEILTNILHLAYKITCKPVNIMNTGLKIA